MIHISSAGCGWAISGGTYTCGGLPKLDIALAGTTITGWAPYADVGDDTVIDQFDHVPQHIEGFRMTLSPIIDMSGGTPSQLEVPELACRVDFDPFNELIEGTTPSYVYNIDTAALTGNTNTQYTGFLDLYNQITTYNKNFYVTIDGTTASMDGAFPEYQQESTMGPGILEPMINTDFGEINVDMPPTPDLTVDAIIYSLVGLQGWRHAIDMRVNNLMVNAADTGMENLEAAKNMEGPCANFQIKALTGYPFAPLSDYTQTPGMVPAYQIGPGTICINGYDLTVSTDIQKSGAFIGYLDYLVDATGATANIVYADGPSSPPLNWHRVEIGRVRAIENVAGSTVRTPFPAGSSYRLYRIEQGECINELEYIDGSTSGYVYMTVNNGGRSYTTDALLDSLETVGDQGYRGAQADAIISYVATHGGTTTTYLDYDGPFKVSYEDNVVSVYDARDPAASTAGDAIVDGTRRYTVATHRAANVTVSPGATTNLYIIAYPQEPSPTPSNPTYIYVQGIRYNKGDIETISGGSYRAWISTLGGSTVYTDAAVTAVAGTTVYALDVISDTLVVRGFVADNSEPIGFYYQYGDSAAISPPNVWYTRLATLIGGSTAAVQQVHYGDLNVVTGGTATVTSQYKGPFTVHVNDGTASIDCEDCPTPENADRPAGYYIVNGEATVHDVEDQQVQVGNSRDVYLMIGVNGGTLSMTPSTENNIYNVLLAKVTGATTATQLHYGVIQVDGRWQ